MASQYDQFKGIRGSYFREKLKTLKHLLSNVFAIGWFCLKSFWIKVKHNEIGGYSAE